ncbi:MAG TPA: DUF4198 domain-containing protein [Vicinamibacterales bacterium]
MAIPVTRVRLLMAAALVAAAIVVIPAPMSAHDFWIAPSAYRPRVGTLVGLRLLVGQSLIGDPVPREPAAIERFVVASGRDAVNAVDAVDVVYRGPSQKPVPGRDGGDPAGILRVDAPGLLVIGYQSAPRLVELTADKFDQYLGEEGLDAVRTLFASKPMKSTARELFSRCAKSILLSGPPSASDGDRALGLPLELFAERSPYGTPQGEEIPFVLKYLGAPRSGALVIALSARNPSVKLSARTDRHGRVSFRFPQSGPWLVKAVHLIPARPGTGADWESFWASSTFELP